MPQQNPRFRPPRQHLWRVGAVLCGLVLMHASTQAAPAAAVAPSHYPPMPMRIVRGNDPACAQPCSEWIAMDGPIGLGSAARFAKLLRVLGPRRLPVLVQSTGGSVQDAEAMGRLIRARHLDVAVSRTALTSCPADRTACQTFAPDGVATGAPVTAGSLCASACSLLLAAGERRFVPLNTLVGVHQFRSFRKLTRVMRTFRILTRRVGDKTFEVSRTLVAERPLATTQIAVQTTKASYGEAQDYFAAMGIAPSLMLLAEATAPTSIHWLSPSELVATRMATEPRENTDLVALLAGDDRHPSATPVPLASEVASSPPSPASESAILADDGSAERKVLRLDGQVIWSVDETGPRPTLLATIAWPGAMGRATLRLDDGATLPGRPDYRMELTLRPGPDSPFRRVLAVGLPALRMTPEQPAVELRSTVAPPVLGASVIDLAPDAAAASTNRSLMARAQAFEIPLIVDPLRTLRITVTRGVSGNDSFRRWRRLVDARLPTG